MCNWFSARCVSNKFHTYILFSDYMHWANAREMITMPGHGASHMNWRYYILCDAVDQWIPTDLTKFWLQLSLCIGFSIERWCLDAFSVDWLWWRCRLQILQHSDLSRQCLCEMNVGLGNEHKRETSKYGTITKFQSLLCECFISHSARMQWIRVWWTISTSCTLHSACERKKKTKSYQQEFQNDEHTKKKTKHNIEEHEFPLIYTVGYIRLTKREHTQTHSLANGKQQIVHFVWMLINFERIPCAFWRWCAWMPHNLQCEYHVDDEICVAFSFKQQVASNEMRSLYFIVHHAHRSSSILFCSGFNYISGANFLPTCLIPFPNAISHFFDRHDWS